jgi:heme/copper-type cytochrome/quinol oxidase subunit 3
MSMRRHSAIDVAGLPGVAMDSQSPPWWGNMLMMCIETMTVALLVATYFYTAQKYGHWPPPSVHRLPPIEKPIPDPTYGSWLVGLLVFATIPMIWADRAAHRLEQFGTIVGMSIGTLAGIAAIVLRVYEFSAVKFLWDENAYASIVWGMLVLHLFYLILEVAEAGIDVLWVAIYGLDEKLADDVTLSTGYWYWTVAIALVFYLVIYWAPYIL